ncbi:uncharacterized protein LOC118741673 isoform X2 [Rhagoletis pomonella]|uniref:uncharacterized protein LOC118741673 isoform X2 n=1 Tax=Rhagoletis pomonella TaxID=28610 RepID=UPI0017829A8E|nr:uncharacterized protein LOC118741673 isoform X2 [Rhagoletis pomonella]
MSVRRKRRGIYQELLLAKQLLGRTVNHYQSLSCGFNVVTQLEEPFLTAEFWDYLLSGDCAEKVSDLDSIECRLSYKRQFQMRIAVILQATAIKSNFEEYLLNT